MLKDQAHKIQVSVDLDSEGIQDLSFVDIQSDNKKYTISQSSSYSVIQNSTTEKNETKLFAGILKEDNKLSETSIIDEISFINNDISEKVGAYSPVTNGRCVKDNVDRLLSDEEASTENETTDLISKSEICLTGSTAPRRSTKKSSNIQKELDSLLQITSEDHSIQDKVISKYFELSYEHIRQNRYKLAIVNLIKGIKVYNETDKQSILINKSNFYEKLAFCYYKERKFSESLRIIQEFWTLHLQTEGMQFPVLLHLHSGKALRKLGKYGEALVELAKAYNLQNNNPKQEDRPKTAYTLIEMSKAHRNLGTFDQAEALLNESYSILRHYSSNTHHLIAVILQELANMYIEQFEYQKAKEKLCEALDLHIAKHGTYSLHTARCYCSIAVLSLRLNDSSKAMEEYKKAMTILFNLEEKDHLLLARVKNGIGDVLNSQKDYQKALQKYETSLAIKRRVYNQNHPDIGTSLCMIAEVYCKMSRYEDCSKYLQEAENHFVQYFGEKHKVMININHLYGNLYSKQGRDHEALLKYQKELNLIQEFYGENYPELASTYYSLGELYEKLQDYENAKRYYMKILRRRTKVRVNSDGEKITKAEMKIRELSEIHRKEELSFDCIEKVIETDV